MWKPSLDNETKLTILKTAGVVRILGKKENTEPLPVPEAKIIAIQRIMDKKAEMFSLQYPKAGEPARIMDGPFAGIEGTVIKSDLEKELFVISIDLDAAIGGLLSWKVFKSARFDDLFPMTRIGI
ncbi:MAG: hypothetical protein M0C28_10660 [Candidatus Moduliflexus flocculans]|nr:hypothetical protein [Candidatus Moduliflexus flocculans]